MKSLAVSRLTLNLSYMAFRLFLRCVRIPRVDRLANFRLAASRQKTYAGTALAKPPLYPCLQARTQVSSWLRSFYEWVGLLLQDEDWTAGLDAISLARFVKGVAEASRMPITAQTPAQK
jgi:hypothetical protein